jgi:outer membrane protein, heavy metal efflux system
MMTPTVWIGIVLLAVAAGCQVAAPPRLDVTGQASAAMGEPGVQVIEHRPEAVDAAEADSGGSVLTLPTAIRRTVEHDPRLQAALARVRSARADSDQARLLPNPILSVGIRFRNPESPIVDAALSQELIALLQRPRRTSVADNHLRAAAGDVLTTLADVVSEVQETYYTVQALVDEIRVLEDRRRITERLVRIGTARFKAGESASLDVITLRSQQMQLDVDIAERWQELRAARLMLARLVGTPSAQGGEWELPPWQAPEAPRASERAWVSAALAARPEVQSKQWELAALGDELTLTQLAALEPTELGVSSERDVNWSVGPTLNVPLPIFDWGQAKRAKASAAVDEARHQLTQLQRQIVQDVRTEHSAYLEALQTLAKTRDELLPLQERRASMTESAYRAGETDVATLLLALEDLLDTRVKVVDLQRKAAVARVKLHRAVGGNGIAARVEAGAALPSTQPATRPAGAAPATQEGRP